MAPLLDLLLTLLHWGGSGWRAVLRSREELFPYLREQLSRVAQEHGERLLHTPDNPISLGITLSTLAPAAGQSPAEAVSSFGSMLFLRCVSGTRTVPLGRSQDVGGVSFLGYGAHVDDYPVPYLTAVRPLARGTRCNAHSIAGGELGDEPRRCGRVLSAPPQVLSPGGQRPGQAPYFVTSFSLR
jgi:O-phospho-L-seryl-tRNASec:L-selenocysteinyl-tRNA synthase